jgi:hypothetical protein
MKAKALMFILMVAVSLISGCCERRCGVARLKSPELESATSQQKLIKMKQEAGGKGLK